MVLRCSIGIPLNRTLYLYLLHMFANEMAMHQPQAVHYIATLYTMYHFQSPFVILSNFVLYVRLKLPF